MRPLSRRPERWLPGLSVAALFVWLAGSSVPPPVPKGSADLDAFGRLPVLHNGRIKPLDTLARTTLLELSGRQSAASPDGRRISADEWLLDVLADPDLADRLESFAVDDPDVLGVAGLEPGRKRRFSFDELQGKIDAIAAQADRAQLIEAASRSRFESAVLKLQEDLTTYQRLKNSLEVWGADDMVSEVAAYGDSLASGVEAVRAHQRSARFDRGALERLAGFLRRYQFLDKAALFRPLPPQRGEAPDRWATMGEGLLQAVASGGLRPGIADYAGLVSAWKRKDASGFDRYAEAASGLARQLAPSAASRAAYETAFNRVEPFYKGIVLYLAALLLVFASWLGPASGPLRRSGAAVLGLAFAVHVVALVSRMVLQGRPPVTNLYSSAVFVGAVASGLGLVVERYHRKGLGLAAGSTIGFVTLIIAHHLASSGDTLEMMRAVLDSNFWLSTHVVAVTVGYSSTFLAAALAHLYIFRGVLTKGLGKSAARQLAQMTYGVVCFALFFSFVGTILGGIWADQSWGRFWGWDPKENGALLIVLWNAMILHARWGGFIKQRGLMVMAVFGAILTSFSWFGVNMLGIGLHSYGWMQQAFWWLAAFVAIEAAVIALALLPQHRWRSA